MNKALKIINFLLFTVLLISSYFLLYTQEEIVHEIPGLGTNYVKYSIRYFDLTSGLPEIRIDTSKVTDSENYLFKFSDQSSISCRNNAKTYTLFMLEDSYQCINQNVSYFEIAAKDKTLYVDKEISEVYSTERYGWVNSAGLSISNGKTIIELYGDTEE